VIEVLLLLWIFFSTTAVLGFILGYYREDAMIAGQPPDLVVGASFALAGIASIHFAAPPSITTVILTIAVAGAGNYIHAVSAGRGHRAAKRHLPTLVIPPSDEK
jgi:hypothetical protein